MKRSLFFTLFVLSLCAIYALTVRELFDKYKVYEGAQYELMDKAILRAIADTTTSDNDKKMLEKAESMEALVFNLEGDEEQEQLAKELGSLKGYHLAESVTMGGTEPSDSLNLLQNLLQQALNPTITSEIYSRDCDSDDLKQPLVVYNLEGMIFLIYIDGDFSLTEIKDGIKFSYDSNIDVDDEDVDDEDVDEDDGEVFEMSQIRDLINRNEYIIAFEGEIKPEFKTLDDARKYLNDNNLSISSQVMIVGRDNVRKCLPGAEAELAFNFVGIRKIPKGE